MKQPDVITPGELRTARARISLFVQREALATAHELGFGWWPAEVTPHGLDGLVDEFRGCAVSGLPFRVLNDHSEDVIFTSPSVNHAMRYWHDTRHVWLGADFSTEGELTVAACHLARAREEGLGQDSLEYRLLQADTVGQTLFVARTHSFVVHQLQFAIDCVRLSFDQAIEREVLRRIIEGTAA
jgi:hypothetical protein